MVNDKKSESKTPENIESKDICFTIMPFGGYFDIYYQSIYYPAIIDAGLSPIRVDDLSRPSPIVNDIWTYTKKAKIILADLTGRNPNVFYELGLAHALAKPVVLISESMEDVPFDLKSLRVITFDKNLPGWNEILKERIALSIHETLESPIKAILPTFLETSNLSKPISVTEQEKALLELKRDFESFKNSIMNDLNTQYLAIDKPSSLFPEEIELYTEIKYLASKGVPPFEIYKKLLQKQISPDAILIQFQRLLSPKNFTKLMHQINNEFPSSL